jgi:hypothetical protein
VVLYWLDTDFPNPNLKAQRLCSRGPPAVNNNQLAESTTATNHDTSRPYTLTSTLNFNNMHVKEGDENPSSNDHGFPPGCFLLRSVSSGRFLDVASDSVQDGAPIILWPEKDNSLVEGKLFISPDPFSRI